MLFSSTVFIFCFLPIVLLLYYICPDRYKNIILLAASILFYTWGENILVIIMLFSLTTDYCAGLLIDKGLRKVGLILSLVINILCLCFFKYYNFILENLTQLVDTFGYDLKYESLEISLPIGISFYTFQSMSYTIDIYRGSVKANKNYLQFATYVTMFPQLVAGPIVRYIDIHKQLIDKNISKENFYEGIKRFVFGLSKKMLIANYCGYIADGIFTTPVYDLSTPIAWLGVIAYSLQIYFDFSGYSDMAIGLGKMFGFDFLENFNFPYIAKSIKEFWRRWHISLSTWFRDYLYIPLGGSRVGKTRTYINLLIVFFITGLWHGSSWNFVIWGFFHGFFIVLERIGLDKVLVRLWSPIQHAYTLLIVIVAWVFFKADNLSHALGYINRMFTLTKGNEGLMEFHAFNYFNTEGVFTLVIGILFSIPLTLGSKLNAHLQQGKRKFILESITIIVLLLICMSYVASDSYNPFIYFRF